MEYKFYYRHNTLSYSLEIVLYLSSRKNCIKAVKSGRDTEGSSIDGTHFQRKKEKRVNFAQFLT